MHWRMRLLLIVDRVRNWLLEKDTFVKPLESEYFSPRAMITDVDSYFDDEPVLTVEVPRDVLADLVIGVAISAFENIQNAKGDDNFMEFTLMSHDRKNPIHEGQFSRDDLLELAEAADVDHVLDYIFRKELEYSNAKPYDLNPDKK